MEMDFEIKYFSQKAKEINLIISSLQWNRMNFYYILLIKPFIVLQS